MNAPSQSISRGVKTRRKSTFPQSHTEQRKSFTTYCKTSNQPLNYDHSSQSARGRRWRNTSIVPKQHRLITDTYTITISYKTSNQPLTLIWTHSASQRAFPSLFLLTLLCSVPFPTPFVFSKKRRWQYSQPAPCGSCRLSKWQLHFHVSWDRQKPASVRETKNMKFLITRVISFRR